MIFTTDLDLPATTRSSFEIDLGFSLADLKSSMVGSRARGGAFSTIGECLRSELDLRLFYSRDRLIECCLEVRDLGFVPYSPSCCTKN